MRLYLIRHGKTEYNIKGIMTGWIDAKLSEEGKENAKKISQYLRDIKIDVVLTSDLTRSIETAKISYPGFNKAKHIVEPRIRERDYGYLAGKNKKETEVKLGKLYHTYHRSYYIPPPSGESFSMVEQRVLEFFLPFIKENINKNVLISAHGNSLRAMFKVLEGLSPKDVESIEVDFGVVYEYKLVQHNKAIMCETIKGIFREKGYHITLSL